MEQILLAYGLLKETIAAVMMLYKNMKVKVCSLDGDIDDFDIIAGMPQGDTSQEVRWLPTRSCETVVNVNTVVVRGGQINILSIYISAIVVVL